MFERWSLRWPITLGVVMIVLVVAVTVGWVLLAVFGALGDNERAVFYWTWLAIGATMLAMILVGVVSYLTLSIKAINLNRRQSNFIDAVTHELKSPIASLKLYLQTLNRRNLSPDDRERFYRDMLEDLERLDDLVSNLLDVARLDRRDQREPPTEVPLVKVMENCAAMACQKQQVALDTVKFDLQPCLVVAHAVDLEVVFRNLIDNAIKYGGEQPEVCVRSRFKPDRSAGKEIIVVEVIDNGRGIPLVKRKSIFKRFVRLGMELQREKPGIGLGLYLVRTLVDRLHGRIRVYDRSDGPGSVFEVQLPALREPSSSMVATGVAT